MSSILVATYKVKSNKVFYQCPNCQTTLENKIEEAGSEDVCPVCQFALTVPGMKERDDFENRRLEEIARKSEEKLKENTKAEIAKREEAEKKEKARKAILEYQAPKYEDPVLNPFQHPPETKHLYRGLLIFSALLRVYGFALLIIAAIALFIAIYDGLNNPTALLGFLSCCLSSLLFFIAASACIAFRDIAINSWYSKNQNAKL